MSPPRIAGSLHAPRLAVDDERIARVVAGFESVFPGARLDHEVTPALTAQRASDRDELLRDAAARRELPFLFTGDDARYLALRGNELPGPLAPGGEPLWEIWLSMPIAEGLARLEEAIANVGRAAGAFWGAASPDRAAAIIASQVVHPRQPRPLPAGLPGLLSPDRLARASIPHRLGWINYWSEATARELDFPGAADPALLARSHAIDGAWLVRLTDDPLDLARPDHLAALRDAYDRFAAIGRR